MKVVAIAVAGALGALARFGVGSAVGARSFPWATLPINVAGSFALGFALRAGEQRGWSDVTTAAISIGFLGAFTTFSTFSVEAQTMLREGRSVAAAAYVAASVVGGILAAALGYVLAGARG